MESTVQTLLIIMILLLGTTLVMIGIQIYLLIREARQNLKKLGLVLDCAQNISNNIASGVSQVEELAQRMKGAITLAAVVKKVFDFFKGGEEE
ncbi:hypothetical protein B5M47_01995 [candidate division CPR3 bacterium 4484_211]|uniref:Uncharacterized protein n=1 Tax=candidate division CPR3 bacterium 4484_211 TaxID=1968527 RepID=A0A1W9NYN1_UNCC3|nr:MAG: hypothetical protein B5M47_01995 [candidate division CPR3 bacterium 4484_211]